MNTYAMSTVLLLVACGGQAEGGALDPQARAFQLSSSQVGQFCDWLADLYGGYGKGYGCDGGQDENFSGPTDRMTCVAQFMAGEVKYAKCLATVEQVQTCLEWQRRNACAINPGPVPGACAIAQGPLCAN